MRRFCPLWSPISSFSSFAPRQSMRAFFALGLASVPLRSPRGPLQRPALRKKLINQLLLYFTPPPHKPLIREGNWLTSLAHPLRSPRGPLQRPALRKKLINQLLLFLHPVSASELAPRDIKTKRCRKFDTFLLRLSLR